MKPGANVIEVSQIKRFAADGASPEEISVMLNIELEVVKSHIEFGGELPSTNTPKSKRTLRSSEG